MLYGSVRNWIIKACSGLRLSQRKTLAELVLGAMRCRRASLADIGRSLETGALAKHNIKRVYRFLRNHRVEVAEGARALIRLAARAAGGRLVVAVDWTDIRHYKVLCAAVPLRGRSIPILFAAYEKWNLFRSQNALEEGFFRLLAALVPEGTQVVVVADRGFGRTELARTLQEIGLGYVIRVTGTVCFLSGCYRGRLDELRLRPGRRRDLGFGHYRLRNSLWQRVLVYWGKGQREPWFLATNLAWGWRRVVGLFRQRMAIEELFRDEKNLRYGWGLRQLSLSEASRLERMLLVLAFAYLFLVLMGLVAVARLSAAHWSAAACGRRQASAFLIGRLLQGRHRFRLRELLHTLSQLLQQIAKENWG